MHSVFWTMAKCDYRNAAVQTAEAAAWNDERASDILSPKRGEDSLDQSYNAFAQESAIDEIAFVGGADPLDLRRKLMSPYPVATRLIDAIERMSYWKAPLPAGKARGFAFAFSSGAWMANVVEIAQEEAGIRVEKVFCATDAGRVFDERNFRMQVAASIVRDLSTAIGRKITLGKGRLEIELELHGNSRQAGNGGGRSAPPVMPALANAVFALTGKRIRRMPLSDEIDFIA